MEDLLELGTIQDSMGVFMHIEHQMVKLGQAQRATNCGGESRTQSTNGGGQSCTQQLMVEMSLTHQST
eukprot:1149164-Pelagomonas_calceolata.AAC.7